MALVVYVARVLISSFNAISYTLVACLYLREYRKRKDQWGGTAFVWVAITCAAAFVIETLIGIFTGARNLALLRACSVICTFLLAPLLFHIFYRNEQRHVPRARLWKAWLGIMYAAAIAGAAGASAYELGVLPHIEPMLTEFRVLIAGAAVSSVAVMWCSCRQLSVMERRQRRWLLVLCGILAAMFILQTFWHTEWMHLAEKLVPLGFLFIITYYAERFTFFDVLIKKGVLAFSSLVLLAIYFVVVAPSLVRRGERHFLVWSLSVWPAMLLYPWFCRKLSNWLDRRWLGRRFSPAQATRYFLSGLQGIIAEDRLVLQAQDHLQEIFQSFVEVVLDPGRRKLATPDTDAMVTPICVGAETIGWIRVWQRPQRVRFLSEDHALLASLSDGLAFLLENLRLRESRLQQETREQELRLRADRSELRALRAQINPHFLFNALNTVAGLIPNHPDRAEETIEELGEVFRYTLHRSEREWVRLEEELEAVRSYLHIEQARFGDSFSFRIEKNSPTEAVRIPAMIIPTLVENAVKHGIGSLTTPGLVEIRVDVAGSHLRIEVRDNGPGFQETSLPEGGPGENGYGLRNIRERLRAHFADAASLNVGRDQARNMTLVSVDMPGVAAAAASETSR